MTQVTQPGTFMTTSGLDLGMRKTAWHKLEPDGGTAGHGTLSTTRKALRRHFAGPRQRVVIEACGCSRWVAALLGELGHEVIVANPRQFHLISKSERKNDKRDARVLAEVGQVRPSLLNPVKLRGEDCQQVRVLLAARRQFVGHRTGLVNFVRGQMQTLGEPLPSCATEAFAKRVRELIPSECEAALHPMLDEIADLTERIRGYDQTMAEVSRDLYPETEVLRQIKGVGPVLALTYVVTLESHERFEDSRDVGAYAGLTPRQYQSCGSDPDLRITKAGDAELRRLLVSAATWILGPFGPDCDLRRFGERIRARGDQTSRGKARIAVARKLAVLLHRLWKTGEVYKSLMQEEGDVDTAA